MHNVHFLSEMRIRTTLEHGKVCFHVESLHSPERIVVVTPSKRQSEFDNNPPNEKEETVPKKLLPACMEETIAKELKLKQDFIHYLSYSNDPRDPFFVSFESYPLWQCVKWQMFQNDRVFGNDALIWNFVTGEFIRMTPKTPLRKTFGLDNKDLESSPEQQLIERHNMQPLLRMEQQLTTKILLAEAADASFSAPSAPPPYDTGVTFDTGIAETPRVIRFHYPMISESAWAWNARMEEQAK